MAADGDVDGDGLSDLVYSLRSTDQGEAYGLSYVMLSERDWEYISFPFPGEVSDVQLGTAGRGETTLVFTHNDGASTHVTKLAHMNDGTPGGQWVDQTLTAHAGNHTGVAFDVRSSGQPVLILENTTTMAFHTTSSFTALEQDVVSTGTMGSGSVNNDP